MRKIKTGIIGMGEMGCQYARMLCAQEIPDMELAAVTRIRKEREETDKSMPAEVRHFQDGKDLLKYAQLDAIIISTPHYLHEPFVMQALEKKIAVFCEKPLGLHVAQVRKMQEKADAQGCILAVMLQQRTFPVYQTLKEIIGSGKYGKLKRISWLITDWYRTEAYYRAAGWRGSWRTGGGGVLMNQCVHALDILQWICGMPNRIQAFCHVGKWHDIQVEDDVTAYMEFPEGGTGIFVTSTGETPGSNRLEVSLENAAIVCENGEMKIYESEENEKEYRRTAKDGFGRPGGRWRMLEVQEEKKPYHVMLNNFAETVLYGGKLIADAKDAMGSIMLADSMYLSSWLCRPVEIPLKEDLFLKEFEKRI